MLTSEVYSSVTIDDHQVAILRDGRQAYPAMLEAMRLAQATLCLETYIYRDDATGLRFVEALIDRANAGVEVLFMYDAWGSEISNDTIEKLTFAGVKVLAFRPMRYQKSLNRFFAYMSRRNHRKSLTIDGRIAFLGGVNICDDGAPEELEGSNWRDTHVRIVGPVAMQLEKLFLETWRSQKGPNADFTRFRRASANPGGRVQIVGNAFAIDRKGIRRAYVDAFGNATSRIYLTNAYFLPPAKLMSLLIRASRRGVRVSIILAADTDVKAVLYAVRGMYPRLLRHGIEVYEWRGRVLHAKTAVIDGMWCTIGSTNLDALSLRQNLEVNAIFEDAALARSIEQMFHEDLNSCEQVTAETVRSYGWLSRFLSWLALQARAWL